MLRSRCIYAANRYNINKRYNFFVRVPVLVHWDHYREIR